MIVESTVKGGSMITAKLADGYNRDVFAVPGRSTDKLSAGCNHLIKHNKAILLTDTSELMEVMGWAETKTKPRQQRELFIELTPDERTITNLINQNGVAHIDEINITSGLSSSAIAAAILSLELQGVLLSAPGKMYRLAD